MKTFFGKVLLADDDDAINKLVKKSIERNFLPGDIIVSSKRFDQWSILKDNIIDLLVIDMKKGGTKIIRLARRRQKNIKIICFSGSINENAEEIALKIGADLFLQKPANKKEILRAIKKLL